MQITLGEAVDRFVILDDNSGQRVSHCDNDGTLPGDISLYWSDGEGDYEYWFDSNQTIRTDGDYFYATDTDGNEQQFRAYTIVNFNDLPPQS